MNNLIVIRADSFDVENLRSFVTVFFFSFVVVTHNRLKKNIMKQNQFTQNSMQNYMKNYLLYLTGRQGNFVHVSMCQTHHCLCTSVTWL